MSKFEKRFTVCAVVAYIVIVAAIVTARHYLDPVRTSATTSDQQVVDFDTVVQPMGKN